jgi:hypothetical protein
MKINRYLIGMIFVLIVQNLSAQNIQGYSFDNYPTNLVSNQKAKINFSSNKLGKEYKTEITEQYKKGKIEFGGHYVLIFWGAGTGLTLGAMVDVKDGKIYALPLNEENSYRETYHDSDNNILYKAKSNLFICYRPRDNKSNENKVDLTYYLYKWDDTTKKFVLLKTKKATVERII